MTKKGKEEIIKPLHTSKFIRIYGMTLKQLSKRLGKPIADIRRFHQTGALKIILEVAA